MTKTKYNRDEAIKGINRDEQAVQPARPDVYPNFDGKIKPRPVRRRPRVTVILSGRGIELCMTSADGVGLPTSHELRAMVRDLILMPDQWPTL